MVQQFSSLWLINYVWIRQLMVHIILNSKPPQVIDLMTNRGLARHTMCERLPCCTINVWPKIQCWTRCLGGSLESMNVNEPFERNGFLSSTSPIFPACAGWSHPFLTIFDLLGACATHAQLERHQLECANELLKWELEHLHRMITHMYRQVITYYSSVHVRTPHTTSVRNCFFQHGAGLAKYSHPELIPINDVSCNCT